MKEAYLAFAKKSAGYSFHLKETIRNRLAHFKPKGDISANIHPECGCGV